MTKRHFRLTILISILFLAACSTKKICNEGLNLLPMYGEQEKCDEQLLADKEFLKECEQQFKNRDTAAKYYIEKGWDFFYDKNYDLAMKRFNQAWLLDSLNSETYWGFGNILGVRHQYKESIALLRQSIKINPDNPRVYECISVSYGQLFFETKDITYLNQSIESLKKAISFDPKNSQALGQLTAAYSYYNQKDSARKYLSITDSINPDAINPEVREILKEQ
jgi:tetratricopeptide (TPR) repeat protein